MFRSVKPLLSCCQTFTFAVYKYQFVVNKLLKYHIIEQRYKTFLLFLLKPNKISAINYNCILSPSPQIHWRIACAVFLQHAGGGEMLQPFLCCALAQACHTLQDATGEAGVGGEIVAEERE